jgi:hypothetical protein
MFELQIVIDSPITSTTKEINNANESRIAANGFPKVLSLSDKEM